MIYEPSSMRLVPGQAPVFYPVSIDPSSVGLDLPIGSLVAFGTVRYVKWGTVSTNWSVFGIPANKPLQTVTQAADNATMTISSLDGNSGDIFRVDLNLNCSLNNTLGFRFNSTAPTTQEFRSDYSIGVVFGSQTGWDGIGFIHGPQGVVPNAKAELMLWLKSGGTRFVEASIVSRNDATPESGLSRGHGSWNDTTTAVTSVSLVAGGGVIRAGSTARVYRVGTY